MNRKENILSFLLSVITLDYVGKRHRRRIGATLEECDICTLATYKEFSRAFRKVYWQLDREHCNSLFSRRIIGQRHSSQFHNGIIEINGVGYILSSYGFYKANRLRKRTIKHLKQYQNR